MNILEVELNFNLVNNSHYSPIIFIIKNWKNKKLPLWFSLTKEDLLQANPNYKTPNALKNDIVFHCIYAVILAEPRVEQEQKPEVCPAPKTMPIGPKHKSYI